MTLRGLTLAPAIDLFYHALKFSDVVRLALLAIRVFCLKKSTVCDICALLYRLQWRGLIAVGVQFGGMVNQF